MQPTGYTGPGAPPPVDTAGIKLSDHVGDLVWCRVNRYDPAFQSTYGVRPTVWVDIEVVHGRSEVGERYNDQIISNVMLVGQLRESVGSFMFARVAARAGNKANPAIWFDSPWAGDEPAVNAFLAREAGQPMRAAPQQPAAPVQQFQQSPMPMQLPGYGQPAGLPAQQLQSYSQPLPPPPPSYDAPPF